MSQYFADNGEVVPVTVLKVPPMTVTQVKGVDTKDKYSAVQVGVSAGVAGSRRVNKSKAGHSKDLGVFVTFVEFRLEDTAGFEVGKKIDSSIFQIGEVVNVIGTMKGRGFAGAMKRHGFKGFPASHGHDKPRSVGSIGMRFPQHVMKGKRMAGHMGTQSVTVKNLQVVDMDVNKGLMMIRGAVPGTRGGMIKIISTGNVKPLFKIVADDSKKKK
ncbi:MAG: 50S ribosomal protein L3 [bacterium]|nr:50S ribosomal protein L3 [bacterium]